MQPRGDRPAAPDDGPDDVLGRRRDELRLLHEEIGDGDVGSLDQDTVDRLLELTDDVLTLEDRATARRRREEHRRSTLAIIPLLALPAVAGVLVLVVGSWYGWLSWWRFVVVLSAVVVLATMVHGHRSSAPDGHRDRVGRAAGAAVVAAVVMALAPGWLPWWVPLLGLAVLVGFAVSYAESLRPRSRSAVKDEHREH